MPLNAVDCCCSCVLVLQTHEGGRVAPGGLMVKVSAPTEKATLTLLLSGAVV